ncbi:MAG: tetratricopeptide repeat protein, partial [Myxococcales bacterium]|nr:tetratricopeptide repeat protein [Myxococcales bacterium]
EGAREQLEGIWDEASRDRVAQGIQRAAGAELADEIWARVSGRLDDYADAWVEGHREACEATTIRAEQSAAVLDRRMACLHRARTALRVDVELLAALDEHTVLRAVELVDRLPMLDRCADVDALLAEVPLPDDPAAQAAIQSAHVRLAEAASLHRLGRYADALEAVRLVEAEAEPLGHGPLLAELAAQEGLTLEALGRYEQAQITLHRAVGQAVEQGSLGVAVGAIADWAFVLDERLSRSDEALLAAELGLRLARRVGQPSLEALALGRVASVLHTQGKWEESEAAYRETLALLEATEPVDVLRVAVVSNDLGAQLFERGQVDEALALHRRALEIREHELGSSHPYVGSSLTNLGNVHYARREHDEAQRYYERALALYARVYGPDHPLTTLTQGNYAALLMVRGELDRADPLLREVVRIKERTYGPDHPETANAYNNLARLEQERGNLDLAHEHLQRSLRSLSTSLGPDHPQLRTALQNLGSLAVELGRRDEAIGHFERALAVFPDAPPEDLADTKMALAKILWDDPSSRARARTLAEDAVLAYGQVESAHQELADAEAWLHTHPRAESE